MKVKKDLKIIFYGTPVFAETSLRAIHKYGYQLLAVVTSPDKAAGRGYRISESAVKKTAVELGLPVLQPTNLKSPEFLAQLASYHADIQVVIAFRMLPEAVWNMPPLGTVNLHASFLPYYRGAAPINRVLMNGETETGVSTFLLKHEIDTGNILLQKKIPIHPDDNAGTLHDKLMQEGAQLLIETLDLISGGNYTPVQQLNGSFPEAPKIFNDDCAIDWNRSAREILNQIRGLSPHPGAYTLWNGKTLKIFAAKILNEKSTETGKIEIRDKNLLLGHCRDYLLMLEEIQTEGKKRMPSKDFINGILSLKD